MLFFIDVLLLFRAAIICIFFIFIYIFTKYYKLTDLGHQDDIIKKNREKVRDILLLICRVFVAFYANVVRLIACLYSIYL